LFLSTIVSAELVLARAYILKPHKTYCLVAVQLGDFSNMKKKNPGVVLDTTFK
jgi:hypothetical protein